MGLGSRVVFWSFTFYFKIFNIVQQSHVDEDGCFTQEAGYDLTGKFIFCDGNDAIIEMVRSRGNLYHEHNYQHSYPYDWRTKKPIFLKTSKYVNSFCWVPWQ